MRLGLKNLVNIKKASDPAERRLNLVPGKAVVYHRLEEVGQRSRWIWCKFIHIELGRSEGSTDLSMGCDRGCVV
jgi:hypothetical protein